MTNKPTSSDIFDIIFGCCLLLDGEVEIYDHEQGTSKTVSFPAGTVLIDPDSEAMYGEGA